MSSQVQRAIALAPPPRHRPTSLESALAPTAALCVAGAIVCLFARRPDMASIPCSTALTINVTLLGVFALNVGVAFTGGVAACRRYPAVPHLFVAFSASAQLGMALLAAHTIHGAAPQRAVQVFLTRVVVPLLGAWSGHLPCAVVGLAVAGIVMAAALRSARRIGSVDPTTSAVTCGAASGVAAAWVLFAFCPAHALGHLAGVHAIPLAATTLFGAIRGPRIVSG